MASSLSPAKVLLLAVHFASHADINSLTHLTSQYTTVLRKELVFRIILTHLPETVRPAIYIGLLQAIEYGELETPKENELDTTPVNPLSDEQASLKARKLHLLRLSCPNAPLALENEPLSLFLYQRAHRMEDEAGLLLQLPDLLIPFLHHAPALRFWVVSTVFPLLKRNTSYAATVMPLRSLSEFERLSDTDAVDYLLSQTGQHEEDHILIGRDFREMIGPWLHNPAHWALRSDKVDADPVGKTLSEYSPGWERVLGWFLSHSTGNWQVVIAAIEQWDGPTDIKLGYELNLSHAQSRQAYLEDTYTRAALACAYLVTEATLDALPAAYSILKKIRSLLDHGDDLPLEAASVNLPDIPAFDRTCFPGANIATYMRNSFLQERNSLTSPNKKATSLLSALILSAFILTRLGLPYTVRRTGDLVFLQDLREQKSELTKLLRAAADHKRENDDAYWRQVRYEILWLHDWGTANQLPLKDSFKGVFGMVSRQHIEIEILKTFLSKSCYTLARAIYEDGIEKPLSKEVLQDTVYNSALNAFDNASNPNRARGGLRKCDEIIHSFPETLESSTPALSRVEALLKATHALSDYRLVLRQGEPFSPVVLRLHSDPISIIEKVLDQNPKAYTRLNEFLEMAVNMVHAGLSCRGKLGKSGLMLDEKLELLVAEKRIVAMCIEAALKEDDFETAYSYVVNRLDSLGAGRLSEPPTEPGNEWSWKAAAKAGQYVRTERSLPPTHLGTASGNLEIRHLEQRIECLATALRVAPSCQLQEVLKSFRRCEEQLESAINEEATKEAIWNTASEIPGAFSSQDLSQLHSQRNMSATASIRQAEDSPMSLFDLSRATARVAQKNFTRLSSLSGIAVDAASVLSVPTVESEGQTQPRARKRDHIKEVATGTLVSGVGWLIGANVTRGGTEAQ